MTNVERLSGSAREARVPPSKSVKGPPRKKRISRLREQIAKGVYRVDTLAIAKALLLSG